MPRKILKLYKKIVFFFLSLWRLLTKRLLFDVLPFRRSVVSFKIFEEAEEERIDSHGVDAEEGRCDEVGPDDDKDHWHEEVVQGWDSVGLEIQKKYYLPLLVKK